MREDCSLQAQRVARLHVSCTEATKCNGVMQRQGRDRREHTFASLKSCFTDSDAAQLLSAAAAALNSNRRAETLLLEKRLNLPHISITSHHISRSARNSDAPTHRQRKRLDQYVAYPAARLPRVACFHPAAGLS